MSAAQHHQHWRATLNSVAGRVATIPTYQASGRVVRAAGLVLEAVGLRVPLGSACRIELSAGSGEPAGFAEAEVVGFSGDNLFLMPLAEISGLTPGARVFPLAQDGAGARRFPLGDDLLGRVVDGNGRPLDAGESVDDAPHGTLTAPPLNPLSRAPIDECIDVGIRALNSLLSIGRGQPDREPRPWRQRLHSRAAARARTVARLNILLGHATPHGTETTPLDKIRQVLTGTESEVFFVLHGAMPRTMSREEIMWEARRQRISPEDRTLDVYVSHIRKKLKLIRAEFAIETVRGKGFRLVDTMYSVEPLRVTGTTGGRHDA